MSQILSSAIVLQRQCLPLSLTCFKDEFKIIYSNKRVTGAFDTVNINENKMYILCIQ